jgi:hypothetical protein
MTSAEALRTGPRSRPRAADPDDDVLDRSPRSGPRKPVVLAAQLLIVLVVLLIGFSVGQALAAPGDADMRTRLGGWARGHHLGFVVD